MLAFLVLIIAASAMMLVRGRAAGGRFGWQASLSGVFGKSATARRTHDPMAHFSFPVGTVVTSETDISLTLGNLVVTDGNGGTTDDTLKISLNGSNVRINDPSHTLGCSAGTPVDANTCDVPLSSITGNIQVNTLGGNDTLTLDFAGGNFMPGGLSYDGGSQTSTPGDKLIITGGNQGTVTYNYTNAHDGSVAMSNFGTVSYVGLEPISNSGTPSDIVFNLPAGPNAATLADDGASGNTLSRLSAATIETTDFANPTGSLTINRGNAADTLAVNALPDFNASLTIGSGANPFNTIDFAGAVTLAADKSVAANATSTINFSTASADLAASGTGTVSLTTERDITLSAGASIGVVNGDITLSANQQVSPTSGDFRGIRMTGAELTTTGTGKISLKGKGGDTGGAPNHFGIQITTGATVSSTSAAAGAGTITLDGTGGPGSQNNRGVEISNPGTTVTSVTGDIKFTGLGGSGGPNNYGVSLLNGPVVSSTGAAKITLDGTGGGGTLSSVGSRVSGQGTQLTSAGGDILIKGKGGTGTGGSHHGVSIAFGALVSATGNAKITCDGTGGAGDSSAGVLVSSVSTTAPATNVTSDSGDIKFTGVGGTGTGGALIGVNVNSSATVVATGSANITIDGTSGTGSGDLCYGVDFESANQTGTAVTSVNGNISVTGTSQVATNLNQNGIRFEDSLGAIAFTMATTGTGSITLTGTAGNNDPSSAGIRFADDTTLSSTGASNTFIADTIDIGNSNVSINVGANTLTLRQKTNGRLIDLGSAFDTTANTLELSDVELDLITCGTLNLGDNNSGTITVSAPITRSAATALNLTSNGAINLNSSALDSGGGNVKLSPGASAAVDPAASSTDVNLGTTTPGTLSFLSGADLSIAITGTTVDTQYRQLNVIGKIDLTGVDLKLSGSPTLVGNEQFVIVDNDDADAITGTFNGLGEGATVTNFLGSGLNATITYAGGDGNDVVLTVVPVTVSVAVSPWSVAEDGAANLEYTFTRNYATGDLTVNFSVGGTANLGTDYAQSGAASYTASTGTVTFTGANTTAVVTIDPTADADVEADETVDLVVKPGSGYFVASNPDDSASGIIENDDFTLVVNSAADPGDGPCTADPGGCTLREAINAANLTSGVTINFDIPGAGVHTISPLTPLPQVTSNCTIDAYTQSGAVANDDPVGDNAILMIELSGANVVVAEGDPAPDGFWVTGGSTTIKGFAINQFKGAGIHLSSPVNEVSGNFIGTDVTGTSAGEARALGNQIGVLIDDGFFNEVGCTFADMRNVISGNHEDGIKIVDPAFVSIVQGNFIGTDKTGLLIVDGNSQPLGNGEAGVAVYDSSDNLIGTEPISDELLTPTSKTTTRAPGAKDSRTVTKRAGLSPSIAWVDSDPGNIIGGNRDGIEITSGISGAVFNLVHGNYIGTDYTRAANLGNTRDGVRLGQDAADNEIGCDDTYLGNIITNNGGVGVNLLANASTGNFIGHNSIYANGGLGIDLGNDDVTANDPLDADPVPSPSPGPTPVAPNNYQNFPEIVSAVTENDTKISFKLHSTPNTCFDIEFFYSDQKDDSGHGEGQYHLDNYFATTNNSGDFIEPAFFTNAVAAGKWITATATDPDGNTSEFSNAVPVSSLTVNKSSPSPALTVGQTSTYTITVTNNDTGNDVNSATVTELISPELNLISATGTDWSCTPGSGSGALSTTCTFSGTLDADGGTSDIAIVVQPKPGSADSSVTNLYSVDPTGGTNPPDPNTCTGSDTPTPGCGQPVGPDTIGGPACPLYFTVDTNSDAVDAAPGDGACDIDLDTPGDQCSLRAAIMEANQLPGCGTIDINFKGVTGSINLGTVLPSINHNVNINGPGANVLTVQRNSASAFRVFTISSGRTVSINDLTIANGSASIGGGIYNNRGTVAVRYCTISGNSASSFGGGIHNGGIGSGTADLAIINSTISGNSSAGDGGGVYSDAGAGTANLTMTNSTVSGNTANNQVGGVYVISSPATLTNVTITNNRADNDNSSVGAAGGLSESSGTVTLHNTIVAGNFRGGSPSTTRDDINGSMQAASSYNLIGDGTGMSGISDGSNHNQVGSAGSPINALLGVLQDNGGPTFTHGLLYNSPAVDKGDDAVTGPPLQLGADQRGLPRQANGDLTAGAVVDIGAYERQSTESRGVPDGVHTQINLVDVILGFPCTGGCGAAATRKDDARTGDGLRPLTAPAASLTVIDPAGQPTPPIGYAVGNAFNPPLPAFDLSTTASVDPPINVCIYLPSITDSSFFSGLKILHNEDGVLVDRTTGQNFASKLVCASVNSLSPFVVAHTVTPTAASGSVSGQILDSNGHPVEGAGIHLSGTQTRLTVTDANGNYHFDNVETNGFYTVVPSRANYTFSPAERSFSALGQHTEAAFTAAASSTTLNPLDATEYFVRQQYLDFLGREPDEAGLNFWYGNIESCGTDADCRAAKRIDTSAAFFLSIEFQQTGYLVYRTYLTAFGDLPGTPVPLRLNEFKPDSDVIGNGVVVNRTGWETQLDQNKQAYMAAFVQRPRFAGAYPQAMTPGEFVDRLFANAGVSPATDARATAIAEFGSAATSSDLAARGRALRHIAENSVVARQEFNQAFVLMQYFGYLRRDANVGPDADFSGYNFWLNKLNSFQGNFRDADMVKAFLLSGEYRGRFPR